MWKLKIAEGGDDEWLITTNNHIGRQHWEFDPDAGTDQERAEIQKMQKTFKLNRFKQKQSADLLMRMQLRKENSTKEIPEAIKLKEIEEVTNEDVTTTLKRAIGFYSTIQAHDGHWPAESAGPLFFLPPLVIALYVTGDMNTILTPAHQLEIKRYIYNHQNEDGGWGLHIESHSTMFGSVLSYVTLRLLGEEATSGAEDMAIMKGCKWILDHGGAVGIPSWGKFWLAVLGIYEWSGCNPMPPELWLLPNVFPLHPGKMLSYFRCAYMPMSYIYGKKFVGRLTSLVQDLREEIYTGPYRHINWNKSRNACAKEDLYYPHPFVQDMVWGVLQHIIEPILTHWPFSKLREKALKIAMEHVHYEDLSSRYLCIGCMEKVICLMATWVEDPNGDAYKRHLARIPDYFWVAEDGMKIQSFGSQMWDTAFAVQAIMSSDLEDKYGPTLEKAHEYVKSSQVRDNPPGDYKKMYRHTSKGAWTFATQDHGWQVSDCTAEGLKVALLFSQMNRELVGEKIETEYLYDTINVILSLQSENGGFTAWEPQRAHSWFEKFNPIEFFEDALVERQYVECTSSAIQALVLFQKFHPEHRRDEIKHCLSRAIKYILDTQNLDGSWYACWGICYIYATWWAVDALVAYGNNYYNNPALQKACDFLLSKQLPDGGWGESYLSSVNKEYTNLHGNRSNIVQTSWALISLIKAGQANIDCTPINHGIRLLINSQMEEGDFPQQEITGLFMKNCILNYSSYRNIFPIWALGEYRRVLRSA